MARILTFAFLIVLTKPLHGQQDSEASAIIEDLHETTDFQNQDDLESTHADPQEPTQTTTTLESPPSRQPKIFGDYRINIGAVYPKFDHQDKMEKFYGDPVWMPGLSVDYFGFDSYLTLGVTVRANYYKDDGNAQVRSSESSSALEADDDGPIELTLIPVQFGPIVAMTAFNRKWIVFSAWGIGEASYFQEHRVEESVAQTESASDEDEEENDKPLVATGWRYGFGAGASLSFLLSPLEDRSVRSMNFIGVRGVYLTPYVEYLQGIGSEKFQLSRLSFGAAFSFETM